MKTIDLHIVSYNIWDLPFVTPGQAKKRIDNVAFFLKDFSADIICLQEAWNPRHNRRIFEILKSYVHAMVLKSSFLAEFFRFSNKFGGLLTLSKFPIISKKYIPFSKSGWFWTEWIGNKGFLETIIKLPTKEIRVINTHLNQPIAGIRRHQLKELFAYVQKDQTRLTILAGDFNENNIYNQQFFIDLLKENDFIHPVISGDTTFYSYRLENKFTQTWINKLKKSGHLDYIFVGMSGALTLNINEYKPVFLSEPLSDHDLVSLKISFNT
jgi:endonuclease/exonuclease/phosphatase family metal-dependent hydrolase